MIDFNFCLGVVDLFGYLFVLFVLFGFGTVDFGVLISILHFYSLDVWVLGVFVG